MPITRNVMTTDYNLSDLNALLDQLDAADRVAVLALLDIINKLIHQYGNMPRDKSTWNDK